MGRQGGKEPKGKRGRPQGKHVRKWDFPEGDKWEKWQTFLD